MSPEPLITIEENHKEPERESQLTEKQKETWNEAWRLCRWFEEQTGCEMPAAHIKIKGELVDNPAIHNKWLKPMIAMKQRANGDTEEMLQAAIQEIDNRGEYSIATPSTVKNTFMRLVRQQSQSDTADDYSQYASDNGYGL